MHEFDLDDLIRCIAPRPLRLVSAKDNCYSADAVDLVMRAESSFDPPGDLTHARTPGAHDLDPQRHEAVLGLIAEQVRLAIR